MGIKDNLHITITGSFSVGKTTFAKDLFNVINQLENNYDLIINEERKMAKKLGFDFNNATKKDIEEYQLSLLIKEVENAKRKNVISDNNIITSFAYSKYLLGDNNIVTQTLMKRNTLVKLMNLYDVIIFLDKDRIPLENDGIRHTNLKMREDIHKIIKNILIQNKDKFKGQIFYVESNDNLKKIKEIVNKLNLN